MVNEKRMSEERFLRSAKRYIELSRIQGLHPDQEAARVDLAIAIANHATASEVQISLCCQGNILAALSGLQSSIESFARAAEAIESMNAGKYFG